MQIDFRLSNVLMTDGDRSTEYPNMYYRFSRPASISDSAAVFSEPSSGRYDFCTYFNAFSNAKWREYASIDNVWLHLKAKGSFVIELTSYEATQGHPKRTVLEAKEFDIDSFEDIDLEYPDSDATLLSFTLTTLSPTSFVDLFYYTKIDDSRVRPVELAVATTTFQKEDFVIPNIKLFKNEVIGCNEPVAKHFSLHVIDNGRTLDADKYSGDGIYIHPNANVGGAGGFTRGMIESIEQQPKATHVILMDDDVQISPESLKRTYNLLSLVNDEYKDALISGAMLSFEAQDDFNEDIGWVRGDGLYGPTKTRKNVCFLESIVSLEADETHRQNCYAGWWYCCVPIKTIEQIGLPLPIFIRGDDAEYGNRCNTKIMTMNGICIWHLTLAFKFRAHLERYMVPRNSLIAQATTGVYPAVNFMEEFKKNFYLDLKTFNYDAAEMSLEALSDFLKGPDVIRDNHPDKKILGLAKKNDKLVDINSIEDSRVKYASFNPQDLYLPMGRNLFQRAFDLLTCNGHRFWPKSLLKKDVGLVPYDGWYYGPNNIRRHESLLFVTKDGTQALLRTMDRKRFKELNGRYKQLMSAYKKNKETVEASYRAAKEELTSVAFWKSYLEID